ncbi:MAG: YkgJ family cysteine cluster protein [Bacteroidales bacterium]|jgi:Fe-S-cluster containining protein|nr:YkgJ family cysteine cluster protein [Bacteroidales bacterium]
MSKLNQILLSELKDKALKLAPETKSLFARLKKKKPKNLDSIVHKLHDEVFEEINCLDCANCCKSISPTLYDKDVERLAKHFKMKPRLFINEYLYVDDDGDYVFKQTPCPFLLSDNYCMAYESRPKACREYPHTDRKRIYQILDLSLKNTEVCPAVFDIVEKLKTRKEDF